MILNHDNEFWSAIDDIVSSGNIIIDRHKGTTHPQYPNIKYELDYGYIENTSSMDGGGIDVWRGSLPEQRVNAIICTVDLMKKDSEIKLLIGCNEEEIKSVYEFHNSTEFMKGMLIHR